MHRAATSSLSNTSSTMFFGSATLSVDPVGVFLTLLSGVTPFFLPVTPIRGGGGGERGKMFPNNAHHYPRSQLKSLKALHAYSYLYDIPETPLFTFLVDILAKLWLALPVS